MHKHLLLIGLVTAFVLALVAVPIALAPGGAPGDLRRAAVVPEAEQTRLIDALRASKRARPVIAIAANNEATEIADFLVAFGVLRHGDVADVTVVAERAEPIRLYPSDLSAEPQMTVRDFDRRFPAGADYVVVPAMEAPHDQFIKSWLIEQYDKGSKIVSICNGSKTLAAAGLLSGRRATGHWYTMPRMQAEHPDLQWVRDRRYVTDGGITTSTGVTANVPVMMALIEAIGGREKAQRVAGELGVVYWDARHRSSAFQLTTEHKKTFLRNKLALLRHESIGVPVADGVDEIALGLTVDAWSRTEMATVTTVGKAGAVRSRHGLALRSGQSTGTAEVDAMFPAVHADAPAMSIEHELARIASRYDPPTASLVALVMEYPWSGEQRVSKIGSPKSIANS